MKKGFTLIELMGTIALLGILSVIVVVGIDKVINDSKEELYNSQLELIKLHAENYLSDNQELKPESGSIYITLDTLITEGYIAGDVENPKTGENFDRNLSVKVTKSKNTFIYEIVE